VCSILKRTGSFRVGEQRECRDGFRDVRGLKYTVGLHLICRCSGETIRILFVLKVECASDPKLMLQGVTVFVGQRNDRGEITA
jgi:hypothetical protein